MEQRTSHSNPWRTLFTHYQIPLYLFLFYVIFSTPLMGRKKGYTVDATPSFQLTQSIAEHGDFFPESSVKQGYIYSLVYLPFYELGQRMSSFFPSLEGDWLARKSMCWMNTIITALTLALLSLIIQHMGFSPRAQIILPFFYGISTLAFAYARYDYNKCLAGFLLLLAFYNILIAQKTMHFRPAFTAGISMGLLAMLRLEMSIVIPIFLFFLVWHTPSRFMRIRLLSAALFPWLLGVFFVLFYNWIYWRGEIAGGYEGGFQLNPFPAFAGFLFSPGKNIWTFNPILLFIPLSLRFFYRHSRSTFWLWCATFLSLFLLYSFWGNWWGGWGWGPRHLVPLIPIMVLPLAAWIDEKQRAGMLPLLLLALLGFIVQLIGSAIDFNDVIMVLMKNGVTEQALIWETAWNPILQHLLFLSHRPIAYWDFGWIALYQTYPSIPVMALFLAWIVALFFILQRLTIFALSTDKEDFKP